MDLRGVESSKWYNVPLETLPLKLGFTIKNI